MSTKEEEEAAQNTWQQELLIVWVRMRCELKKIVRTGKQGEDDLSKLDVATQIA